MRIPFLCLLLLALPCSAQEKMSREDTAAILFSNRFSFTADGEPVLSIRIMEEQKSISFIAPDGLAVQPSGPGGPTVEVKGKLTWTLSTSGTAPAKLGWQVVLDEWPTNDFERGRQAAARFSAQGVQTTRIELGTLFSFQGTVFDTRTTLLCTQEALPTSREAEQLKSKMEALFPGTYRLVEVLVERPSGDVILEQRDRGLRLVARNAIWFEPLGRELTVENVEFAKGFPWHGRETRSYTGQFYGAVDRFGMLAIANVLPAEQLLRGLVPAEIYPDSPAEALKAQAVTARNELFSKIGHRHLSDPYLLCGDQHCQVYKGLGAHRKQADQAVRDTRGHVMFDGDGRLADARYHSTCGGHTENAVEAWPEVTSPNLVGRTDSLSGKGDPFAPITEDEVASFLENPPDSYCGKSPKGKSTFRWTKTLSAKEMDAKVATTRDVGSVRSVTVLRRGVSGRVNHIRIQGSAGEVEVKGELVIRRLFGGLKSSLFVLSPTLSNGSVTAWTFKGGGFGHGVGMCQLGAAEMARAGKSFLDILQFYYKSVTVKRIY